MFWPCRPRKRSNGEHLELVQGGHREIEVILRRGLISNRGADGEERLHMLKFGFLSVTQLAEFSYPKIQNFLEEWGVKFRGTLLLDFLRPIVPSNLSYQHCQVENHQRDLMLSFHFHC